MSKCLIVLSIILFSVGCAHAELPSLLAKLDATATGDQPDGGFILCKGSTTIPNDTIERIVKYKAELKANDMDVRTYLAMLVHGKQWVCIKYAPIPVG